MFETRKIKSKRYVFIIGFNLILEDGKIKENKDRDSIISLLVVLF